MSSLIKALVSSIFIIAAITSVAAKDKGALSGGFDREVKVHLGEYDSVSVSCDGEMVIECYRDKQPEEVFYSSSKIDVVEKTNGISLKDENGIFSIALVRVIFRPRYPSIYINFGSKRYRGGLMCLADFTPETSDQIGKMSVFNEIDIEDYLKGVLPGEMGQRNADEIEALKAQAIAARTYAIWKLSDGNSSHLKNTIEDQVYLGASAEMPLHTSAVEATSGMVMAYHGRAISAYYFAVCGGSTISREKAWGGEKVPYLKGVDDDSFCVWAKSYSWKETFTPNDLNSNLGQYFGSVEQLPVKGFGTILNIIFKEDKNSGRTSEMKVETSTGIYKAEGDKIRWALKRPSVPGAILPSTRFTANLIKDSGTIVSLEISGTGNGHGVGMCQCGAIGRSRKGESYSQILKTYYKGIRIEKAY
jgi:stage II sporulation protein D